MTKIDDFIQAARDSFIGAEYVYMHGSCYYFAKMLQIAFPGGEIVENFEHVYYDYKGKTYDIRGEVWRPNGAQNTPEPIREPTRHGKFNLIEFAKK